MTFALKNLTPGASCELQLYTVYETKESDAYITVLFTTSESRLVSSCLSLVTSANEDGRLCFQPQFVCLFVNSFLATILIDPMHLGGSSCGTGMKRQFWLCGIGLTQLESTPITKEFNRYQLFLSGKKKG
ncbi:uncharacterized protein [Palaemon carinicauda]|uniref:uncharacterized protein isoform X7 n=1 Tax=Palaemon carinicauda TaxID=392227 RepID=UPI0035B6809C